MASQQSDSYSHLLSFLQRILNFKIMKVDAEVMIFGARFCIFERSCGCRASAGRQLCPACFIALHTETIWKMWRTCKEPGGGRGGCCVQLPSLLR